MEDPLARRFMGGTYIAILARRSRRLMRWSMEVLGVQQNLSNLHIPTSELESSPYQVSCLCELPSNLFRDTPGSPTSYALPSDEIGQAT
jgi:hypothetical protein